MSRIIRLTLLAAELVEELTYGKGGTIQLGDLLRELPSLWTAQQSLLQKAGAPNVNG